MKQLVILIGYINVFHLSANKARTILEEGKAVIERPFTKDLENETNCIVKTIIIPSDNTAVECIFPVVDQYNILEKLNEIETKINELYDRTGSKDKI